MRTMLFFACLLAAAAAAPVTYDQKQEGELNVRADVQNVVLLVAYPQKMMGLPPGFLDGLLKNSKRNEPGLQERSDIHVMEAFVEPSTPYHVEIGDSNSYSDEDGRAVVIAGAQRQPDRRRLDGGDLEDDNLSDHDQDEFKLIGATEQCGPDRERDPETLTCRARSQPAAEPPQPPAETKPQDLPQPTPEVVLASA